MWIRKKLEDKKLTLGADAHALQNSLTNASSVVRKQGTKNIDSTVLDQERLNVLYKKHRLDLQLEKETGNNVNFEKMF